MEKALETMLTQPAFLWTWCLLSLLSEIVLWRDLIKNKQPVMPLMRFVWTLTVLYSGLFGLAGYYYSGRKQIPKDDLWRRAFRSVSHCYSGCGAGEVIGVIIAAGLLSLGNLWISCITFLLAYIAGYALTAGPLIQEGTPVREALWDAFTSETASITVMEIVAIGVDLYLAKNAGMKDLLFWSSLVFSLSMGLLAAYPINVLLLHFGVKKGMHSPKEMA